MKILHLGGIRPEIEALAKYQRQLGHKLQIADISAQDSVFAQPALGPRLLQRVEQLIGQEYDQIHLHGLDIDLIRDSSTMPQIGAALEQLKKAGCRLSITPGFHRLGIREVSPEVCRFLADSFDMIFVAHPAHELLLEFGTSWAKLPISVDLRSYKYSVRPDHVDQPQRLLLVFDSENDAAANIQSVLKAIEEVSSVFESAQFMAKSLGELRSLADAASLISAADIFIDATQHDYYGLCAVTAMALGKTTLAPIRGRTTVFPELELTPILSFTPENLNDRLAALLREPKALRDLCIRSRKYVESYHNAEITAAQSIEAYTA